MANLVKLGAEIEVVERTIRVMDRVPRTESQQILDLVDEITRNETKRVRQLRAAMKLLLEEPDHDT